MESFESVRKKAEDGLELEGRVWRSSYSRGKKMREGKIDWFAAMFGLLKKRISVRSLFPRRSESEIAARFARSLLPSVFAPRARPNQSLEPTSGLRPAVAHL